MNLMFLRLERLSTDGSICNSGTGIVLQRRGRARGDQTTLRPVHVPILEGYQQNRKEQVSWELWHRAIGQCHWDITARNETENWKWVSSFSSSGDPASWCSSVARSTWITHGDQQQQRHCCAWLLSLDGEGGVRVTSSVATLPPAGQLGGLHVLQSAEGYLHWQPNRHRVKSCEFMTDYMEKRNKCHVTEDFFH